ncbi:hypothetical protein [Ancylomarina sp. 16SWW S1-10-2]|nr:hypothetical protein [Ancylomarina sp. 16SWW S1-10-2]
MKKLIYALCLLLFVGTILSSCSVDKKCPAYSKVEMQKTSKTV